MGRKFKTISKDDKMADEKRRRLSDKSPEAEINPEADLPQFPINKIKKLPFGQVSEDLPPEGFPRLSDRDINYQNAMLDIKRLLAEKLGRQPTNEEIKAAVEGKSLPGASAPAQVYKTVKEILAGRKPAAPKAQKEPTYWVCPECGTVNPIIPGQPRVCKNISDISRHSYAGFFESMDEETRKASMKAKQPPSRWGRAGNFVGTFLPTGMISDRLKKNILELVLLFLGVAVSGFLGFYFLAVSLALAAFWIILPSQTNAMEGVERSYYICPYIQKGCGSRSLAPGNCNKHGVQLVPKEKTNVDLENKHVGVLYMKSFIKLLIIIFLVLEFSLYHPYHLLIPIIILFVGYFSLPTKYYNDEPYKAADAWFRQLLGFVIAFFVLAFLTPAFDTSKLVQTIIAIVLTFISVIPAALTYTYFKKKESKLALPLTIIVFAIFITVMSLFTFYGNPALSVFYLCIAFFTTRPVKESRKSSEGVKIEVNTEVFAGVKGSISKVGKKLGIDENNIDIFGNAIFFTLMLAAGFPILAASTGGQFSIIFLIVWLMSMFMGYVGGREGRPYLGIIMISFAILAFSFQYGDTIGFAVFKQYWAPLKAFTTVNLAPALDGLNQANKQLSLGVECAFDPVGCQQRQQWQQRQQSIALGSQFALEEAEYSAQPADSIDVNIPTFVSLTMENRGDFDIPPGAKITLTIPEAKFADIRAAGQAQRAIPKPVGDISSLKCTPAPQETTLTKTCTFKDTFVKSKGGTGGRALAQFELVWKKLDELQTGATINEGGKKIILQPDAPTYNVTLSFVYSAKAEYKRDIFSEAELTKRLLNPSQFTDFNPTGLESKYSGGPVLAAVWMPPIQIGSENLITGSVVNQRGGTAKNFKYCLYFPKTIVADYGTSKPTNAAKDGCDPIAGFLAMRCSNPTKKLLPSGTSESSELLSANKQVKAPLDSYDCSFKMKFNTQNVPKRELNILATLSYEYENTITKFLPSLPPFGISSTDTGGGSSGG